jgi:CHAD domain-containing protein
MSTADSILLSAFDERWKNFRSQHKTCRMEFSEEAVHDLRVAARRMLAVLGIARSLIPQPRVQKARRDIKDLIEDLDELRDVQVMLVEISENIETFPELKSFQKALNKREAKLMRTAYKRIKQKGLAELSKRIKKIRELLEKEQRQGEQQFHAHLLELVENAYSSAEQAYGQVNAEQIPTIHNLRLAFKRFRYLAEIVYPLKHGYPVENLERMHDYQGMMGDIQDAEIFLVTFSEYVEEHALKINRDNVTASYSDKLKSLVNQFMENKGEISVFWGKDKPQKEESKNEPVHHTSRDSSGSRRSKVRRGQPAAADRQGEGQDEENRAGIVGDGNTTRPDPVQPGSADDGDGENPGTPA